MDAGMKKAPSLDGAAGSATLRRDRQTMKQTLQQVFLLASFLDSCRILADSPEIG